MSLDKLKELRKRRKEGATIALQKSKDYLLACEQQATKKHNELQHFKQWRLQHQEALFSELQVDNFSPEDLGRYLSNIENMKATKHQLEQELEETKRTYQQAEKNSAEKKSALLIITKKLEKLSEIIDIKKQEHRSGDGLKEEDIIDEIVAFRASTR